MSKYTEADAIMDYVERFGAIIPAKMHAKVFNDHFFGSEVTRQCRALRQAGKLVSRRVGKFTEFFLPSNHVPRNETRYVQTPNGVKEVVIHNR